MKITFARINPHLLLALSLAFVYHGALLQSGTFKRTYDAFIHIFLADHYARAWFDHWDYRWYTGFTLTSYPPGSQQTIALISPVFGLLNGFILVQLSAILLVILGVYRFSRLWVSEEAAGYAALLAVFSSSITETVHVFGQLPTTFSLGFLLNALPYAYAWLDSGNWKMLFTAWLVNAATTAAHHVTTLFGAVFFVAPVIGLGLVKKFREPLPDEPTQHPGRVSRKNLRPLIFRRLRRIALPAARAGLYGAGLGFVLIMVVLPYWLWSKDDPISQVPIPHASRDSFIENTAAGLVFWLMPWGVSLVALPYAFYKGFSTKAWPLAASMGILTFLGTGGTTPFPKMLLGGAYMILTLDRFTFWATITVLPFLGEFVVSMRHRRLAKYFNEQLGSFAWRAAQVILVVAYLAASIVIANATQYRRFQPPPIDVQPIVNFLDKDQHSRWRYLTLGFGDQMAWLSAQTTATSVDGNYHSVRRLPEMTTTSVERLEGAKFRGIPGIGSLQQFLAVPEKYNLKFIFSNDQFYDPLLFFSGWHRLQRLENGIMVWEREDIPPLPEVLPRAEIPIYQRVMWGIIPMAAIISALLIMSSVFWGPFVARVFRFLGLGRLLRFLPKFKIIRKFGGWIDRKLLKWSTLPADDDSPDARWQFWINWFRRLPRPKPASPSARALRVAFLSLTVVGVAGWGGLQLLKQNDDPVSVVKNYYDDLDFRRYDMAYARLDPTVRPSIEQYRLELSVTNGLVASYGKLDSVKVQVLSTEPDRVIVQADTNWITALAEYPTHQRHTLVKRNGRWFITPDAKDTTTPPDEFFSQGTVSFFSQGRRQVTTGTTNPEDVLDRPELQILSARLVKNNGRYSVVGEVMNTSVNPADLTVTAVLFDDQGNLLTRYNAQFVIVHKLLPKEITPFRVDFEGVAGQVLEDTATAGDFKPGAYSPVKLEKPVASFDVYAKAVVTGRDLDRSTTAQSVKMILGGDGNLHVTGNLLNSGTQEATIPHLLVTYYDTENRVVWVDQIYVEAAVRPQRQQPFDLTVTAPAAVETILDKGRLFTNVLQDEASVKTGWAERIALPPGSAYASFRVSLNYFEGGGE